MQKRNPYEWSVIKKMSRTRLLRVVVTFTLWMVSSSSQRTWVTSMEFMHNNVIREQTLVNKTLSRYQSLLGETNVNTSALATPAVSTNAMGNYFPTLNVAHQLPVKLISTNFLLWKTQFLPMICGCGLNHYIDDLDGDQPNPAYKAQLHNLRRDNATIECYVQGAKSIVDKLAALQHPITNDDLVEFVLAGLGPAYRPFTRSLESRHDDVTFDALYGMLLNEERQLKREDASILIAPTTQYIQSSIPTQSGRGRGSTSRGRGCFSGHGSSPQSQSRHYVPTTHSGTYSRNPPPFSDFSGIFCHNCEGNGHIAHAPLQSHAKPTTTPSLSLEIPSNTLPNKGGNQMVDFEQSGPLSDVHHPNKLSCSSSKSHPMTT
ncbi:hypothetical protein H5410_039387 [Solanum commersonii]|uniref:Uncharacterized protein n=1 Tax=Solanum commersonii TaxID=4109 RepID=A0A9J5XKS1_SOLCO|nr:hypothetical protein H5410_039387 [Solanum commersonii]